MMKPYHLNYSAPPPQVAQFRTSGHHPPLLSLNDPHKLEEDIIYTITQALCQQIGATMCLAVLVLPHVTPQLKMTDITDIKIAINAKNDPLWSPSATSTLTSILLSGLAIV